MQQTIMAILINGQSKGLWLGFKYFLDQGHGWCLLWTGSLGPCSYM